MLGNKAAKYMTDKYCFNFRSLAIDNEVGVWKLFVERQSMPLRYPELDIEQKLIQLFCVPHFFLLLCISSDLLGLRLDLAGPSEHPRCDFGRDVCGNDKVVRRRWPRRGLWLPSSRFQREVLLVIMILVRLGAFLELDLTSKVALAMSCWAWVSLCPFLWAGVLGWFCRWRNVGRASRRF